MKILLFAQISFLSIFTLSSTIHAATPVVGAGGQLEGATGVVVNGDVWDVEFTDNPDLGFLSITDPADLPLGLTNGSTWFNDSGVFASALLDQVLLDGAQGAFDSQPFLTRGCESLSVCRYMFPVWIHNLGTMTYRAAINWSTEPDADGQGTWSTVEDPEIWTLEPYAPERTLAVWTPGASAPEPGTMLLFGLGAIAFSIRSRSQRLATN